MVDPMADFLFFGALNSDMCEHHVFITYKAPL